MGGAEAGSAERRWGLLGDGSQVSLSIAIVSPRLMPLDMLE
jgi:hypothetical protein